MGSSTRPSINISKPCDGFIWTLTFDRVTRGRRKCEVGRCSCNKEEAQLYAPNLGQGRMEIMHGSWFLGEGAGRSARCSGEGAGEDSSESPAWRAK